MQCTVNIDRGCRALCSIGGKGDDNTHTSVQRNRFSRNQERSEQTGESVRNPGQRKAAAGLSGKDFRVHYSPQTTPQMSLLARAGSRVITGQTSEYGGVIQRCGAPVGGSSTGPYAYLKDGPTVGVGKGFTAVQKQIMLEENKKRNSGVVKSDNPNDYFVVLTQPKKSMKGVTPAPDEWQFDHIVPRDKGGTNSYSNCQIVSRKYNREKWNK